MLLREQQAILRSQDGDLTGLGVLFELHQQAVFRTAYGIVGNHHMAEEVTQQTFVELFTAIKRFDHKRSFHAMAVPDRGERQPEGASTRPPSQHFAGTGGRRPTFFRTHARSSSGGVRGQKVALGSHQESQSKA